MSEKKEKFTRLARAIADLRLAGWSDADISRVLNLHTAASVRRLAGSA